MKNTLIILFFIISFIAFCNIKSNNLIEKILTYAPPKKIKYKINLRKMDELKKDSFNENFFYEFCSKISNLEKKVISTGNDNKNYEYLVFSDYTNLIDIHIILLPSNTEAVNYFSRIYKEKEYIYYYHTSSQTNYYGSYLCQSRYNIYRAFMLMNRYVTNIGIQNGNVCIEIYEYTNNIDKKNVQKYIDLIADTVEKQSNKE